MSEDVPICHCAEYYGSHAPDCPIAAEVRALRAKAEKFGDLLVEIETVADENCTETGRIARGALFQIRSKIHQFAAMSARSGDGGRDHG